ncbi:MAG: hypothetical protein V9E98_08415 [Candidatus Nanopelagicales bacterium]
MSEILVLVEHSEGTVKKVTLELLTLARGLGEPSAVVIGSGVDTTPLAEYGAATIYVADDAELTNYVVGPKVDVLAQLVAEKVARCSPYRVPAADGKETAGRLGGAA